MQVVVVLHLLPVHCGVRGLLRALLRRGRVAVAHLYSAHLLCYAHTVGFRVLSLSVDLLPAQHPRPLVHFARLVLHRVRDVRAK